MFVEAARRTGTAEVIEPKRERKHWQAHIGNQNKVGKINCNRTGHQCGEH